MQKALTLPLQQAVRPHFTEIILYTYGSSVGELFKNAILCEIRHGLTKRQYPLSEASPEIKDQATRLLNEYPLFTGD